MHELSIASAILATALRHAENRPVDVVAVKLGGLRQVSPASLSFYWNVVRAGSECEGARLDVIEVGVRLRCVDCNLRWEPAAPEFRCPDCTSGQVEVIAGEELEIAYLEVIDT